MWWDYTKAVILIVLIIAAAYYVTKFVASKTAGPRGGGEIRIRSSVSLGKDRQLVIAEIGGKAYLLGVTPQHVELVGELNREELDSGRPEEPPTPPSRDFGREFWERFRGTYQGPGK